MCWPWRMAAAVQGTGDRGYDRQPRLKPVVNPNTDPDPIDRALEANGERTKKAAVARALEAFIARRKQKPLLDLMGKLDWDRSADYKAGRSRS